MSSNKKERGFTRGVAWTFAVGDGAGLDSRGDLLLVLVVYQGRFRDRCTYGGVLVIGKVIDNRAHVRE